MAVACRPEVRPVSRQGTPRTLSNLLLVKRNLLVALILVVASSCSRDVKALDVHPPETSTTTVPVPTTPVGEMLLQDTDVSCDEASQGRDELLLLRAFRSARLSGRGAEACLSVEAMDGFYCRPEAPCSSADFERFPGPGCLYACPGYALVNVRIFGRDSKPPAYILDIDRVEDADAPPSGGTASEGVTLGMGTQYGTGALNRFLIISASGAP